MSHLEGLNDAQSKAVNHPPNIPLQILAGPGSGKTKVLTARIVHLIVRHGIHPSAICAVTFTNKAANEMRERLTKMLGKEMVTLLKMGTFHSLCARFVRRYATLLSVESNFTVCDADESKKIVTKLLKPFKKDLTERAIILTEATIVSRISRAKARGQTPKDLLDICRGSNGKEKASRNNLEDEDAIESPPEAEHPQVIQEVVAKVYAKYQRVLRLNNSLDFDDLLIYGVRLFKEHPHVSTWCQHILVDEFQDTNIMQYDLMSYIASTSRCVTVVGDPDQSIYGWRSAEVLNLSRMKRDFAKTQQIALEQNYRSTGSILAASLAIVSEDKTRIPKTLFTSHADGPKPTLYSFSHADAESGCIASEIKKLVATTGGMLGYNDFAILLRYNALSRPFESALRQEGIPCRILGGHRFFERLEVKDLLAYLQTIDNPQFVPAFTRIINVPARSIGDKTVAEILSTATRLKLTPIEVVQRIHDGKIPDIKPPLKRKTKRFVEVIRTLTKLANHGETPATLIQELLKLTQYEEHLKKTQPDWENRWENVQELINFATQVEGDLSSFPIASQNTESSDVIEIDNDWDDSAEPEYEDEELDDVGFVEIKAPSTKALKQRASRKEPTTPLRAFLQIAMLSTDAEAEDEEEQKKKNDRVTISTCHAAKGLEWPVVFVPAVEQGVFPASRTEDVEEERRLLYVACTRAQGLLYLTHVATRMRAGEVTKKDVSEFIAAVVIKPEVVFSRTQPHIDSGVRSLLAAVIGRSVPSEGEVEERVTKLKHTAKYWDWSYGMLLGPPGVPPTAHIANMDPSFQLPDDFGAAKHSPGPSFQMQMSETSVTFMSARSVAQAKPPSTSNLRPRPLSPSRKVPNTTASKSSSVKPSKGQSTSSRESLSGHKARSDKSVTSPSGPLTAWIRPKDIEYVIPSTSTKTLEPKTKNTTSSKPRSDCSSDKAIRQPASSGFAPPPRPKSQGSPPVPVSSSASPLVSSSSTSPAPVHRAPSIPPAHPPPIAATKPTVGGKRRLGMSRGVVGYPNKKFKLPT